MDKKKKKIKKVCNIILSLMLCLFSAFSFAGCGGVGGGGGTGNVDNDNNDETQNPGGSGGQEIPSKDSGLNDTFLGAILVTTGGGKYYDKYVAGTEGAFGTTKDGIVDFKFLVDRQFETMATYLWDTLHYIYGTEDSLNIVVKNFGVDKVLKDNTKIIYDDTQKQLAGLGVDAGIVGQTDAIRFKNSIEGYDLLNIRLDTTGDTASYTYSYEDTKVDNTAWNMSKVGDSIISKYTKSKFENDLRCIYKIVEDEKASQSPSYKNLIQISAHDIYFNPVFDGNRDLKNYYSQYELSKTAIEGSIFSSNPDSIGLSREYLWHVAYFLAYAVIGETNFVNSIEAYDQIFATESSLNPVMSDIVKNSDGSYSMTDRSEYFQNYKGYHIVIAELVETMSRLIATDPDLSELRIYSQSLDNENNLKIFKKRTLFPSLSKVNYTWIDNVDEICEACDDNIQEAEEPDPEKTEKWTDEDWDKYWDEYYRSDLCKSDPGTFLGLKQIILVPKMSKEYEGEYVELGGVLLGLCVDEDEESDIYRMRMGVEAICEGTRSYGGVTYEDYNGFETYLPDEHAVEITKDYRLFLNLLPVNFHTEGMKFGNAELLNTPSSGYRIENVIANSFVEKQVKVDYELAGYSKTFTHGYLRVFDNELMNEDGTLNIAENLISINFDFYDANMRKAEPYVSLMFFCLY